MANLSDLSWSLLLKRMSDGECTPFLGAGASASILPLGHEMARELPERASVKLKMPCEYPFQIDKHDLAAVCQWLSIISDRDLVEECVRDIIDDRIKKNGQPPFDRPDEIHGALARFPLPIYLTTNYDPFMFHALAWASKHTKRANIEPQAEYCRWTRGLRPNLGELPTVEATEGKPLVYHLHGYLDVQNSLVLTEEDYETFLVELSINKNLIPHNIMRAISDTTLLFVGYALRDWNFRVLFRAVVDAVDRNVRKKGVTVQLDPGDYSDGGKQYLEKKFARLNLEVYWGSAPEFARELSERSGN
jgi:hypothetical protein